MESFPAYVDANRLGGRHGFPAMDWRYGELLAGIPFAGGDVLDLGAGEGLLSLWLLYRGARSVLSLEPEAAGSTTGVGGLADSHRRALGVGASRWEYRQETLQSLATERCFQLVVSHASINHLDEAACVALPSDPAARTTYTNLFAKLRDLLAPGGHLVITDCARHNYWNWLGLTSPFAPGIEWHKHQEPKTWCELARLAGLTPVSARFSHHYYRIRRLSPLLTQRHVARCLTSTFVVAARK